MAKLAAVVALILAGAGSAQELVQSTDINATGPCAAALNQFCAQEPFGNGSKAQCLVKAWVNKKQIAVPCQTAIKDFFKKAAESGFLEKHVAWSEACMEDIHKRCASKMGTEAYDCLEDSNRKELNPACREKVNQLERLKAKIIELDSPFFNACKDDLDSIPACHDIPKWKPASGRKACLIKHKSELSSSCHAALFKRMKKDLQDVRLMPSVFTACQAEIKKDCGGLAFGEARVLKCLWENREEAGVACKEQVTLVTKEKLSDYRLDYRIRTRCAQDITKLCQKEQWLVDNLTISELFGDEWTEGKSGLVLQCLKANFAKIEQPACKPEIQRLVRVHAEAPTLDPVFNRTCKADIAAHCNKTEPERVHLCLRNHLKEISPSCREAEITQGSLAAMDISMKPQMKKACAQAIKKYCSDVVHGDAQVIQCLQDHLEEEDIGSKCEELVESDLEASNHDWRLKFGVHHACMTDANILCSEEIPKAAGSVLTCLKTKRNEITGASCKAEIFRFMRQGASNIKFAPNTYNACVQDVGSLCANVRPGQGRIHECLAANGKSLTPVCARAEFEEQQIVAEDVRMHPKAKNLCKTSIKNLCTDVAKGEGRIWQCLSKNKDDPKMALGCRAVVTSHEKLQNYEFHLNPQLSKHCSKEAVRLCPFEAALADYKEFGGEGETISCLIKKRTNVTSLSCKAVLLFKTVQRLANVDNSPEASTWCSEDISRFCADVPKGSGRVHACLQKNLAGLSADCRQVELDNLVMQSEDARLLPFMEKDGACVAAKKRYCADVAAGEGRRIMCMLKNMDKDGMETACRNELQKVLKLRSTNIRFNPMLAKSCKTDLQELQEKHKQEARCQKQDDQEVALEGRAINCLTEHAKDVKKLACQASIMNIMLLQSADFRAKPGMKAACENDIAALCPSAEPGTGRVHKCLRNQIKSLSSEQCKGMVKSVWELEKQNAILNPAIRERCHSERSAFCPSVEPGQQRLLVCLYQNWNMTGFGESCRTALTQLGAKVAVPALAEGLTSLLSRRSFWDKWGMVLLAGIALLLIAWLVCLGFLIRFVRNRRSLYGIHVDQPDADDNVAGERG